MARLTPINPTELGAPRGYSNGMLGPVGGRLLFVAGQIAWNRKQKIVSSDFARQFDQALGNVVRVVREAGGEPSDIGRLLIFVTDKQEYLDGLPGVGEAYRRIMGRHYPAMSLVQVADLLDPGAKIEIEAMAVLA